MTKKELEKRIAALEAQVAALSAQVAQQWARTYPVAPMWPNRPYPSVPTITFHTGGNVGALKGEVVAIMNRRREDGAA